MISKGKANSDVVLLTETQGKRLFTNIGFREVSVIPFRMEPHPDHPALTEKGYDPMLAIVAKSPIFK